ncbi:PREDICTED: lymphocyte antigen 6E-like [Gekko japonicus]|uniref:Lymphocyte antigen 6E-like n=1 Tax=Gekko japonicus TaxID=146911 RepID=A0ABM1LFL0_GEKJA|nr:PREDICTED: lymphocyte antigen 6E-like [Gekko japonicus]
MKGTLAALIAVLLCVERASSLVCFHCDSMDSNWDCLSMKTCKDTDKYCITKYIGGGYGENRKQSISKGCSATCPEAGLDLGVMAFSIKCCEHSFCNTSGAVGVKSSFTALAVGTLASLLYIFGAKL